MRGHGFAELIACHAWRTNRPKCDQRHDTLEMRPVASDAGPQCYDIATLRLWRLRARGDKGRTSARFQYCERALRDVAADRIEHGVAVLHGLGKIHRIVVDDLVGTDFAQVIMVRSTCGRDHACTEMFCQLDGKARDTTGAALD